MKADEWAARLASGERIAEPVAIVVAHADDETLFTGSLLGRLDDALLIHVTDSAPHNMTDARRLGFETRDDYAKARAAELSEAVTALGGVPARRGYDVPDQDATACMGRIVEQLVIDLADRAVVVTHAYEGGHPDHDACACAVAWAVARLGRGAPARVEFPSYQLLGDERVWACFWPDADHHEHVRPFDAEDERRVDAALAAHASQAGVFDGWRPLAERWRSAPAYDFTAPPPSGYCLYDRFGWQMTSVRWRALARGVAA